MDDVNDLFTDIITKVGDTLGINVDDDAIYDELYEEMMPILERLARYPSYRGN
jgi:hypothetical protein